MNVVPLPDEWEDKTGAVIVFSPTQITTYTECARKWAWRRIEKIYVTPKPSAALGTRTHSVLEKYLREGVRPDFVTDREAAEIATSGLHLLPAPKTKGMQLEREFFFKSERTGFVYSGYKDVEIAPGVPVPTLEFDGTVPIVIDHKTTKSIDDYAKTKDDLLYDAQATLYGLDAMLRFAAPAADLAWLYYQTKSPRRSHVTSLRLDRPHALRVFDAVESVGEECASALTKNLRPLDLPPNIAACGDYGGCPYKPNCSDLNKPSQIVLRRKRSMTTSVIANLRARVQNQTAPSTPTETTPPPTIAIKDRPDVSPELAEHIAANPRSAFLVDEKKADEPVMVNPPESKLAPPPSVSTEAPKEEEKPKTKRVRRTSNGTPPPPPDPKGADAAMHTGLDVVESNGAEKVTASGTVTQPGVIEKIETKISVTVVGDGDTTKKAEQVTAALKKELEQTIEATTAPARTEPTGFTLYVDCIPIGRGAKVAAGLFANAQARMAVDGPRDAAGQPVPDYRLVDYGKGAPAFVSFVLDQVDGTFDIALDTRSPEGALLLEPLMSRASFVVRGFR